MSVIVDNGAYTLRNMGDVAMLQVAIRRLRQFYPRATMRVLTTRPDLLARYCPGTKPLSVDSRDLGYEPLRQGDSAWQERWRHLQRRVRGFPEGASEFQDALEPAQAVVLAGGGFLNDLNPTQTRPVLRMLADAGRRGKRIALLSQGLGPLDNPELVGLLGQTCRAGARVALREACRGPDIMRRAGVASHQYTVTGDDALELAQEESHSSVGNAIGFSIRKVGYSGIEVSDFQLLNGVIKKLEKALQAPLASLPVSFNTNEADHDAIARVVGSETPTRVMDTPEALVRAASSCRIVITGTYHAATFALAQGTPCVCFYASDYYRDKMEGLSGQFPRGCELVDLRSPAADHTIHDAALRLWDAPEPVRSSLKQAAEHQLRAGRHFYQSVFGFS